MIKQRMGRMVRARMIGASILTATVGAAMAMTPVIANAAGKPACYTRKEMAAEQLIRLHTELMVIGLTCQTVFPEEKTFAKYQEFTVKNRKMISDAEGAMIAHFGRTERGNATSRFDSYRTDLANTVSRRVGVIGSWSYCQQFIPRQVNAVAMSQDDVKLLVSDEKASSNMHLASRPLCDVKIASLPDPVSKVEPPRGKGKTTVAAKATKAKAKPTTPVKAQAKKPTPKVKVADNSKPSKL